MFRPEYMTKNTRSSQRYKKHEKNSMSKRDSLLVRGKWDKNLLFVPLRQRSKACQSIHFLLYDY